MFEDYPFQLRMFRASAWDEGERNPRFRFENENEWENETQEESEHETGEAKRSEKPFDRKDSWADICGSGELRIKTLRKGSHSRPQPGDVCEIALMGTLDDGTEVDKHDQLTVQIGDHDVVQGLELALPLMTVGEKALVIVSARFGYGTIGNPPDIPPNATVTYVVELFSAEVQPPVENIPHDERKTIAILKHQRGNWWYERGETTKALQCYKKAADLLDETIAYVNEQGEVIENTPEKRVVMIQQKIKVYENMAAAQMKLRDYDSALLSIFEVLFRDPDNVKALHRKSKILMARGNHVHGLGVLRRAYLQDPLNTAIIADLNRYEELIEDQKRRERELYRRMIGQPVGDAPVERQMKNNPPSNSVVKAAVSAGAIAAAVATLSCRFKNPPSL